MLKAALVVSAILFAASEAFSSPARLAYTLRVDAADLTGVSVELRIRNAPAAMQLAAHAHPEYDDKYWQFVRDLRATDAAGNALDVVAHDSVLWRFKNAAGDVTVKYRVQYPRQEMPRSSWKPFLAPTGALIGGPHSFLYVVGAEQAAATVTLDIPPNWRVATGLQGVSSARTFQAPTIFALMESPMLVGIMHEWAFRVKDIPHRVFYWPLPNAAPFDTVAFVSGIEKLAQQSVALFGSTPYAEYTFLIQDGAYSGGLEHPNSVTLGAPSAELAKNVNTTLAETAHEFVHTWNLMAIKPMAYREVDYRAQPPVSELWFSEGLTLFYADLLLRRSGAPRQDSSRVKHLESLIARYLSMAGNAHFSAEQVSRVEYNAPETALGNYAASSHLQGELIGSMLDMRVRDATDGTRNMDDVMRLMYQRFRDRKFNNADVAKVVGDACQCTVSDVFSQHVTSGSVIDFQQFLTPLGFNLNTNWVPAADEKGNRYKDLSIYAWLPNGESLLRLRITKPTSVWAKAGLNSGDQLVSINGQAIKNWAEFRQFLSQFAMSDSARIIVQRPAGKFETQVVMRGYEAPVVRISPLPVLTEKQRRLQAAWMAGR